MSSEKWDLCLALTTNFSFTHLCINDPFVFFILFCYISYWFSILRKFCHFKKDDQNITWAPLNVDTHGLLNLPLSLAPSLARVKNTTLHVWVPVRYRFRESAFPAISPVHLSETRGNGGHTRRWWHGKRKEEKASHGKSATRSAAFYRELCASSAIRDDSKI